MNIRILGSKESLGVKFKDGICAHMHLKLYSESDWYFCNIIESGWFCLRKPASCNFLNPDMGGECFYPHCCLSLNTSETVKAVNLAFRSIQ